MIERTFTGRDEWEGNFLFAFQTLFDLLRYANVRTDFSRSHWRVFAAAINAPVSLVSTTPASCPTFAVFNSARPPLSTAIALR